MSQAAAKPLIEAGINLESFTTQLAEALAENFDNLNGESGDIDINNNIHLSWKIEKDLLLIMLNGENAEIDFKHNAQFMN